MIDRYTALLHTFSSVSHNGKGLNIGFDLRFYTLSTAFLCGYYYYLYIQETRPQANPTGFIFKKGSKTQLTKKQLAVKDFQLKKNNNFHLLIKT